MSSEPDSEQPKNIPQDPRPKILGLQSKSLHERTNEEHMKLLAMRQEAKDAQEKADREVKNTMELKEEVRGVLQPFEEALIAGLDEHPEGLKISRGLLVGRDTWTHAWRTQRDGGDGPVDYLLGVKYKYGDFGKNLAGFNMRAYKDGYYEKSTSNVDSELDIKFENGKTSEIELTGKDRQDPLVNANLVYEFNSTRNLPGTDAVIAELKGQPSGDRINRIKFNIAENTLLVTAPVPVHSDEHYKYVFNADTNMFEGTRVDNRGFAQRYSITRSNYVNLIKGVLATATG